MTKWLVDQKYFDNGKVKVEINPCEDDILGYEYEDQNYSCYGDVFDNEKDARKFYNEVLRA